MILLNNHTIISLCPYKYHILYVQAAKNGNSPSILAVTCP